MEKLLQALYDAGFFVHITPFSYITEPGKRGGEHVKNEDCVVCIMSLEHMNIGSRGERWEGHGLTVDDALRAACAQLQQRMRTPYDSYLTMAKAFGWEL